MQFLKAGTLVRIMPSEFVKDKYWNLRGRVATYNAERNIYRIEIPGLDDREIWVAFCDLIEGKETETCDGFIPETEEELKVSAAGTITLEKRELTEEEKKAIKEKKAIVADVHEDPPIAVPGFVTVTAKAESLLCPDFDRKPFLYMIRLDRIDDVQEAKDGTACIFLKSEKNNIYAPAIVTVESFDEVARRMRRATEHAEDHRD